MKQHSCMRRVTTALLTLALIASMFTICGVGALASEDEMVELPTGFQINGNFGGGFGEGDILFPISQFEIQPITLIEGHTIRSGIRAYTPSGRTASLAHHIYIADAIKIIDSGENTVSQVLTDETYGYQYQEYASEAVIDAASAGENRDKIFLYTGDIGNPNYSEHPLQFFGWDIYDVTDNKLLASYDGSDFLGVKRADGSSDAVAQHAPLYYNASQQAAKAVMNQIDALDETNPDEAAITAARAAYDALTEAGRTYVTNLAKLEAAERALAKLNSTWDYKALLSADTTGFMSGTYPNDLVVELPVGFQVDAEIASGFADTDLLWPVQDYLSDEVTLVEGHKLRSVLRANCPNGVAGELLHHIYVGYSSAGKVIDLSSTAVSSPMEDETYHYPYQEFTAEDTVSATAAGTNRLHVYLGNLGNPNYSQYPVQLFKWELYDVTDDRLLLSYDASDFLNVKQANLVEQDVVRYHSPVMYNPVFVDHLVGYTATAAANEVGCWTKYDLYTKLDQAPVRAGDVLQMGVKIWKEFGYNEVQPYSMTLQYYANALTEPDSNVRVELESMEVNSENAYESLDEFMDEEYGFSYKLATLEHEVTDDEVDCLNAKGVSPLIGHTSARNYDQSPLSLYGYYVYNMTQDVYYINLDGAALMSIGGTGTLNEPISLREYNTDYATAATLNTGKEATFSTLTVDSETVGQYRYTFDVKGESGKQYHLKAYVLDDQGKTAQIGQKTFAATGEQETVAMTFNLRDDNAGKKLCFGIQAIDGTLGINTVTFDGRTGDYGDNDEYDNQLVANTVIEKINALPSTVAISDEAAIVEARTAFDNLTEAQKPLVDNLNKLTEAERQLQALKDDIAAANAVIEKINAIDAENPDKEDVQSARDAYDALSASQQKHIDATTLKKLTDAEEKLAIQYGDINGDKKMDAADALMALQHSVQLIKLEGDSFTAADVDQDGKVDATDALYILQYSVKLIPSLPVSK